MPSVWSVWSRCPRSLKPLLHRSKRRQRERSRLRRRRRPKKPNPDPNDKTENKRYEDISERRIHPSDNKLSRAEAVEVLALPDVVNVPLSQHIGAPAVAKVAKGDKVKVGELIAEAAGFVSANIHAPCRAP